MQKPIFFSLVSFFLLLLISCDPLVDDPDVTIFKDGKGTVGAKGGIISVEDSNSQLNGVKIEIPEGALSSDIEISIHEVGNEFLLKEAEPDAFWIRMEPSGAKFEKPVKIGIPYGNKNPEEITMWWSDGIDKGGEVPFMEIDANKKMYYAGLDHFTYFGLTGIFGGASTQLVKDSRDDKYYLARKVGTQWWFMNDAAFNVPGSRVYNDVDSMANKYGRLYNWQMSKQACPSGWRLPSKTDFQNLELEMGMTEGEVLKMDGIRTNANVIGNLTIMGITNYLQGSYDDDSGYDGFGYYTGYWTSTESYNNFAWSYSVFKATWFFVPFEDTRKEGFNSVKCMK